MQRRFIPTTMRLAFEEALKPATPLTPLQALVVEALRKPVQKPAWRGGRR